MKIIAIGIAILTMFALVSCGQADETAGIYRGGDEDSGESGKRTITVVFNNPVCVDGHSVDAGLVLVTDRGRMPLVSPDSSHRSDGDCGEAPDKQTSELVFEFKDVPADLVSITPQSIAASNAGVRLVAYNGDRGQVEIPSFNSAVCDWTTGDTTQRKSCATFAE